MKCLILLLQRKKGRKEFEKEILKAETSQASETGLGLGQTRNALSPELRAGFIVLQNNIVVNSNFTFISYLYQGAEFYSKEFKQKFDRDMFKDYLSELIY